MKRIITALSLVACATVALANDGYRLNAGESDADLAVKIQLGSAGENTYYINQAGQPDLHQPQVG